MESIGITVWLDGEEVGEHTGTLDPNIGCIVHTAS